MSDNNHLKRAKFKIITYQQSPHYEGLLSLREKVLRKGLQPYTADQLSVEKDDIHIGLFDIFTSQLIGCFLIKNVDQWCQMRQVAIEPSPVFRTLKKANHISLKINIIGNKYYKIG